MSQKDNTLTSESNYGGVEPLQHSETYGFSNQGIVGNKVSSNSGLGLNASEPILNRNQYPMSGGQSFSNNNPLANSGIPPNSGISSIRDLSAASGPSLGSATPTSNGPQMNSGTMLSNKPLVNNGQPINSSVPTFKPSPSTNMQSGHPPNSITPLSSGSTNIPSATPMSTSFSNNMPPVNTGSSSLNRPPMNMQSGPNIPPVNSLSSTSSNQTFSSRSPINMQSAPPTSRQHLSNTSMSSKSPINSGPPVSNQHSGHMMPLDSGSTLNSRSPINIQTGSSGSNLLSSSAQSISSGPTLNRPPINTQAQQPVSNLLSSNMPPVSATLNNRPPVTTYSGQSPLSSMSPSSMPLVSSTPSSIGRPPISSPSGQPISNIPSSNMPPMSSGPSLSRPQTSTQSGQPLPNNPPSNMPPMTTGASLSNRPPMNTQSGQQVSSSPMNYMPVSQSGPPTSGVPPMSNGPLTGRPPMTSGYNMQSGPQLSSGLPSNTGSSMHNVPLNRPPTSGGPPISSGPPFSGSSVFSGPPSYSGPSVNSRPPTNIGSFPKDAQSFSGPTFGPQFNTGLPQNRPSSDATQIIAQQLQNVNLPASTPPTQYGYKAEPQQSSAANRTPDMRPPNYPNSSPYNNQVNYQNPNIAKAGFNKIWGMEYVDLLQSRNILPPEKIVPPRIKLHQELLDRVNCSPEIFRCTLTKIPDSNSLLQKARLPLGILIHPFKDLNHLPVIQCSSIVRCRSCRTYINPFIYFVDSKRWKCNLCYKVNELPEEFLFDPATKTYGDPSRRPEIRTSTIEFIAPSEYMLRPPQPAVYLFIFDVSKLAIDSGYLSTVCKIVAEEMSRLPGDSRTQVGFLAVNTAIHFFSMPENASQPHQMIMLDIDDVFLPCPDNLLVNLKEREELIKDLLTQLPCMFKDSYDTNCALGAALQVAFKLTSPTGGRVTVFQCCLPNLGPGALQAREDPNTRAAKDVPHLNPATDFYKRLALDCSGQQVAVDLFLLNGQYSDLATLSGICKFSGGCIYYLPLFQSTKLQLVESLEKMLRRYLNRKIGFEAVMRIRCTRGLSIHTFHGNFFVRSTDLLSLPNINPDAGFGMQVTIEENLSDMQNVCFQAALLYTSSKGERRIRVHTLCLPITSSLSDVIYSADQQCIIGLLAKMAVDRSLQSSLSDAREALLNAVVDALSAYKVLQGCSGGGLLAPHNLKLMPMYIMALLKSRAFRFGINTRLDDRVFTMCQLKSLPLSHLIQLVYPDLYPVHEYVQKSIQEIDGQLVPQPERLHLSAEKLDSRGAFLLDAGDQMLLYVGKNIHPTFCSNVLGVQSFAAIPEEMYGLPDLPTPESETLRTLVASLQDEKPYFMKMQIIRDDGHFRNQFTERLIEDRLENALSYYEFLQHIKNQVK